MLWNGLNHKPGFLNCPLQALVHIHFAWRCAEGFGIRIDVDRHIVEYSSVLCSVWLSDINIVTCTRPAACYKLLVKEQNFCGQKSTAPILRPKTPPPRTATGLVLYEVGGTQADDMTYKRFNVYLKSRKRMMAQAGEDQVENEWLAGGDEMGAL